MTSEEPWSDPCFLALPVEHKPMHALLLIRILAFFWALAWRHRLEPGDRVIKVRGWRTALIENQWGDRLTVTWLFRFER